MTPSVSSSRRRSIGNTRLMSRRASVLSYAWCEMARSACCAPFGMTRKVGSPLRLNGRSLRRCTPPLETSATVLCASGLRSGVQGISPVARRLSWGSAMSLLTQWPNAVPTGMTPNRTALPPAFISLIFMSASSELDHAAVDYQLRPHDERGFAGREVKHRAADLIRLAESLERDPLGDLLLELPGRLFRQSHAVEDRGRHCTGAADVHSYSPVQKVGRQGLGQVADGGLGGPVDGGARHAHVRVDRCVQDDGGAARQKRKRLLDGEEGALEVGRHGFVEKRFGHVLEGDELADAGVDEQGVDPAESLLDPVHRS